ncbi:MAG: NTP transferase domain-containing protein [candidate division Zixibacteria bacterium]|nr:NTP transferase domain-containing protein [candidate division Zixibacteria bacterium]
MQQATGIILAGGKGSRINKDKALITLPDGATLIQKCVHALKKVVPHILIISDHEELYQDYGARVVKDLISDKGPLGGIFTGLCYSTSYCNFVTGCDMPFPQPRVIECLLERCDGKDVVIPEIAGEVEPLFAAYTKNCLPVIFDHLQNNDLKIRNILADLKVERVGEKEIDKLDPGHLSFFNINTAEDLNKAQVLLSQISDSG